MQTGLGDVVGFALFHLMLYILYISLWLLSYIVLYLILLCYFLWWSSIACNVTDIDTHTSCILLCLVVKYKQILPIPSLSLRITSLALGQSYDCPSASEVTLKNMGRSIMWTTKSWLCHNKTKHNKILCMFHRLYTIRNWHVSHICCAL